ncbi:hypothetical protein, partial [Phocaeicola sp.]
VTVSAIEQNKIGEVVNGLNKINTNHIKALLINKNSFYVIVRNEIAFSYVKRDIGNAFVTEYEITKA